MSYTVGLVRALFAKQFAEQSNWVVEKWLGIFELPCIYFTFPSAIYRRYRANATFTVDCSALYMLCRNAGTVIVTCSFPVVFLRHRVYADSVIMCMRLNFRPGLGFCHGKKYFCQDTGKKPVKTTVKPAKTGNTFSALNWIDILWCNYNSSLNH